MPWKSSEATGHSKKANTPKKRAKWASIANAVREESGDDAKAIRIANASVDAKFWKAGSFLADKFVAYLRDKKVDRYDLKGRREGYFEEQDDDEMEDCKLNAADSKKCPDCDGDGKDDDDDGDCETCGGSGEVESASDSDDALRCDAKKPPSLIRMYDRIEIDDSAKVRFIDNGYVTASPRIARTGVQVYHGNECGLDFMDTVRVYRPESEVFDSNATHTYTHLPLTLDHPSVPVNSSNWKKYAVGETGDEVLRDGNAVRVPMMLRDADAIRAFKEGTNQLSVGYDCSLEITNGVTKDGEPYDAIQRGIRANHLAVVAAARGGPSLTIGDDNTNLIHIQKGDDTMNVKTILVDGLEVQVADSAAPVIQRTLSSLEARLQALHDKFKKKEDEDEEDEKESEQKDAALKAKDEAIKLKDKEIETKSGEIAALKSQLADAEKKASPQAIDTAARERASVIDKANTVMGSRLKTDGMTVDDIRRAVVEARIANCKDWSNDRISGAFEAMQSNAFSTDRRSAPTNLVEDAVRVFGRPGTGYQSPSEARDAAYSSYDANISEAWRGKAS